VPISSAGYILGVKIAEVLIVQRENAIYITESVITKFVGRSNLQIPYTCVVNKKVDHIDNVVISVLGLAISVILNKISIQSMNLKIWVSSLGRLGPNGICDKVFET